MELNRLKENKAESETVEGDSQLPHDSSEDVMI